MSYAPKLRLPQRKRKGLIKLFGGLAYPTFYTSSVVVEGTPMKPKANPTNVAVSEPLEMQPATASDGAKVFGLAMQITYDDTAYGQLEQYAFHNDTAQRLDGMPIGVLGGQGLAYLENYEGVVVAGEQLAVGASGILVGATTASADSAAKVRVWADTGGTAPAPIRIRFDFEHSGD